jgi:hypothetical protein
MTHHFAMGKVLLVLQAPGCPRLESAIDYTDESGIELHAARSREVLLRAHRTIFADMPKRT